MALLLAASFGFNQRVVAMISPAVADIVAPYKIAPAAQQVVLYIASKDGRLYAISIDTHDVVWGYQGGASFWSRPAVANGVVYIGNQDEYLHAVNSSTGELLWKFKAEASVMADPIVAGGAVYFGVVNLQDAPKPHAFYAVDSQTGEELWKFQADARILEVSSRRPNNCFGGYRQSRNLFCY
jgi:outer membrane protein assembly factor BamB